MKGELNAELRVFSTKATGRFTRRSDPPWWTWEIWLSVGCQTFGVVRAPWWKKWATKAGATAACGRAVDRIIGRTGKNTFRLPRWRVGKPGTGR